MGAHEPVRFRCGCLRSKICLSHRAPSAESNLLYHLLFIRTPFSPTPTTGFFRTKGENRNFTASSSPPPPDPPPAEARGRCEHSGAEAGSEGSGGQRGRLGGWGGSLGMDQSPSGTGRAPWGSGVSRGGMGSSRSGGSPESASLERTSWEPVGGQEVGRVSSACTAGGGLAAGSPQGCARGELRTRRQPGRPAAGEPGGRCGRGARRAAVPPRGRGRCGPRGAGPGGGRS